MRRMYNGNFDDFLADKKMQEDFHNTVNFVNNRDLHSLLLLKLGEVDPTIKIKFYEQCGPFLQDVFT